MDRSQNATAEDALRRLADAPRASVGVVSDTHGLVRPELVAAFEGCDLILHAGDVGAASVLDVLRRVAPVVAVRGNVDTGEWAATLPATAAVKVAGVSIRLVHDQASFAVGHGETAASLVVFGHSHRSVEERRGDVLFVNPGSAGPRRFSLPATAARLEIADGSVSVEMIDLDP
jgi:putative phosphoesterase